MKTPFALHMDQHYFSLCQKTSFFEWDFLSTLSLYILKTEQCKRCEFFSWLPDAKH